MQLPHTHTCRGFLICVWGEQMCWYLNNLWPADTVAISPHKWPQTPPPPLLLLSAFLTFSIHFQRSTQANGQTMTHCLATHSTPAKKQKQFERPENLCSIVLCPVFKKGSRTHPYSRIAMVPVASRAAFGASAAGWPICCVWYWFSRSSAHSARTRKSHLMSSAWR